MFAEFGGPDKPGCRILKCDDIDPLDCGDKPVEEADCNLGYSRKIWVKVVNDEFQMGHGGGNEALLKSSLKWLKKAGKPIEIAAGSLQKVKWY